MIRTISSIWSLTRGVAGVAKPPNAGGIRQYLGTPHAALPPRVAEGDGAGGEGLQLYFGDEVALTIVWCHGLGDTGYGWADAFGGPDGISAPCPFKVVLPTAPVEPVTINGGMSMPSWYDIYGLDRSSKVDANGIAKSVRRVAALVDRETNPVVLGGFSQGGAVALAAALDADLENLVGLVAASSYLPLADDYNTPPARRVPALICHGDLDPVVDPRYGRATRDKLVTDLGFDCDFQLFAGLGHSARLDESPGHL